MRPAYELYRPRWYRRRMPIFWWLRKPAYVWFICRELTSLAVAYAALLLLVAVAALGRGEAAWEGLLERLASPYAVAGHAALLAALLFHTLTWLHLAPKAMVVRLGRRRLPDAAVLVGHYLGWAAASALVAWSLLAG